MAVAPNDNALLLVADLLGAFGPLGLTATDAGTTDMIQELINRVSDQIEAYCKRPLKAQDYAAIRLPSQRGTNLRPGPIPLDVDSPITLTLDGLALTVWRKESDGDPALKDVIVGSDDLGVPTHFYRACGWLGCTPFPIVATFTAGYDPIPGDLKEAATMTAQAFHRHQKNLDPYSSYPASATGGTVVMRTDTIPQTAEDLLAPYVRYAL